MADELREYRMLFERVAGGERAINPRRLGERSKLGGLPDWDQVDATPSCPDCFQDMTFIAQIDSIEQQSSTNPHSISALSKDQQYMFGDVGMIYVFFCFNCLKANAIFQCG